MKSILLLAALTLVLGACKNDKKFETCAGQPVCTMPPTADNAPADLLKLRENVAGKWKLIKVATVDTIHKTGRDWTDIQRSFCISYDGGVQFFMDNHVLTCKLCYELTSRPEGGYNINVDHAASNTFCKQSFPSGEIKCAADSLVMISRDSFIIKRFIYRRMNDDGTYKVSN